MDFNKIPPKVTGARFVRAVKNFASSEVGWRAKLMSAALVALLCGANGLNVLNSYVGRHFMDSIANRNNTEFVRQAAFYVGVFAASTVVAVIARYAEERLGLLWRDFLTRRVISLYMANGTYRRLFASGQLANPDQRIADDIRAFTVTTPSFVLMLLNSSLTIVAFSGVLWSISPFLFVVAVLYAAVGSFVTILLGRPLIGLNYDQLDKEASFRSALLQVQENAESIMVTRREDQLRARLLHKLGELVANFRRITSVNRNVGFFTTGYNWLIQIIPTLIVAPAFIRGEIDFGAITQSGMAFSSIVAALSLIVTQFQSLSTFAAVIARLSSLTEAIEQSQGSAGSSFEVVEADGRLAYEGLTLPSSTRAGPLIENLSISISTGTRVLLTGTDAAAGVELFRATAGLSTAGAGRIFRPRADDLLFLPQRPYLPPGTLRQVVGGAPRMGETSDDKIIVLLRELNLESVMNQHDGLDTERDWGTLSLKEQQLLAVVHILLAAPQFVFLDRIGMTLGLDQMHKLLEMLAERSIAFINSEADDDSRFAYDATLNCKEDGGWIWTEIPYPDPEANQRGPKTSS